MNSRIRKFLSALAVPVIACSFAGCGGSSSTEDNSFDITTGTAYTITLGPATSASNPSADLNRYFVLYFVSSTDGQAVLLVDSIQHTAIYRAVGGSQNFDLTISWTPRIGDSATVVRLKGVSLTKESRRGSIASWELSTSTYLDAASAQTTVTFYGTDGVIEKSGTDLLQTS